MSRRFLSIQLHNWPLARMRMHKRRRKPEHLWDDSKPFALFGKKSRGPELTAVNKAAEKAGLFPGMGLADSRSIWPALQLAEADEQADGEAFLSLAEWCRHLSPRVALDSDRHTPFALMLDISGCTHLFGGEKSMLAKIDKAMKHWSVEIALGVADQQALAWAFARFGHQDDVHELPVQALRLEGNLAEDLQRLGFRHIGDLVHVSRPALLNRFGQHLCYRLDAILHGSHLPFRCIAEPPLLSAFASWPEPVFSDEGLTAGLHSLTVQLTRELKRENKGALELKWTMFSMDGRPQTIGLQLNRPQDDPDHLTSLFIKKLIKNKPEGLSDFGIEVMRLEISKTTRLEQTQHGFHDTCSQDALSQLLDQLAVMIGSGRIKTLKPHHSHWPENGQIQQKPDFKAPKENLPLKASRPLRLLGGAEQAAYIPLRSDELDHATFVSGPERILSEWWTAGPEQRDYWRLLTRDGRDLWVFYDHDRQSWYQHGSFA